MLCLFISLTTLPQPTSLYGIEWDNCGTKKQQKPTPSQLVLLRLSSSSHLQEPGYLRGTSLCYGLDDRRFGSRQG